jgi:hypothetical protein
MPIVVDMIKARRIHMDAIRVVRDAELAAGHFTYTRAMEAGDTRRQATIAAARQHLRDIPQTFSLEAETPEELRKLWPDGLPRPS